MAKVPSLFPSRTLYCSAKAALGALSASVQAEINRERKNIKIATIYPGLVFTEGEMAKRKRCNLEELRSRALKPKDIAHVVWMILSQGKNSNITEVIIQPLISG